VYNIGEEWEPDDVHGRFFYSFSPELELSEKLKAFAEVYGYTSKFQEAENTLDAGFLYQFKPNLQFDLCGGIGIAKAATDNFIELGMSFRLPG